MFIRYNKAGVLSHCNVYCTKHNGVATADLSMITS